MKGLKNIIPKRLPKKPTGEKYWVLRRKASHLTSNQFYLEYNNGDLCVVKHSMDAMRFNTKYEAQDYRDYVKINGRRYMGDFKATLITLTERPPNQHGQVLTAASIATGDSDMRHELYCDRRPLCNINWTPEFECYTIYTGEFVIWATGFTDYCEALRRCDEPVWCIR